jgi:cation-transporting P-type ATPase E
MISGLTPQQVLERRAQGLGNRSSVDLSLSYWQIFRRNVFTFINFVLVGLGIALVILGRPSDAIVSVLVILTNVVVSVVQEIRAKRTLDRIALLTRPRATVIRSGEEQIIDPDEIVQGDILVVHPGDQVVVDGQVVGEGRIQVDESLLSGEADLIAKAGGDEVYSGSFCVTGSALYEAQKVGVHSLANQITSSARAYRRVLTPLQRQINLVTRVILVIAIFLEILLAIRTVLDRLPLVDSVSAAVVIIGLVPNGLFLAISIAYAMGAVRIASQGVLVQQSNAIESLSNVNLLCMDKTGTLTTNRIRFHAAQVVGIGDHEFRQVLGDFNASVSSVNRTNAALLEVYPGQKRILKAETPFASAWKFSAVQFDDPNRRGAYVLGAPDVMLTPPSGPRTNVQDLSLLEAQAQTWADEGLRVLLFAAAPDGLTLMNDESSPTLPSELLPLGLVSLEEELRPEAQATLDSFARSGVQLKIISGDNPHSVAALARQAGFPLGAVLVSGIDLAAMSAEEFTQAAVQGDIFGRITPQQKERLVQSLQENGRYVSMIGDGVNDVLSLKKANLGIALQSGSQAARSVADIILLDDSFADLLPSLQEGRRIILGMQDILKLFLTRVLAVTLLILAVSLLGGFPFAPKHISILTLFTVGIPSIALAAWASPGVVQPERLVRRLFHFVLPASLALGIAGLIVFLVYSSGAAAVFGASSGDLLRSTAVGQTALTHFATLCGLLLILFVEPPSPAWTGGDVLSGDKRPAFLALTLFVIYNLILLVPPLRQFFDLAPLGLVNYLILSGAALCWGIFMRWFWRARWFERFFDVDLGLSIDGNDG